MNTTVCAVAAVAALVAAATAEARPLWNCDEWICGANGPQLTGIVRPALDANRPLVTAVTLASGETVEVR
jgi:hypothetical protein